VRRRSAALAAGPVAGRLPGATAVERLANGLTVCRVENRQAPVVTTALWYRAGARDEPPGHAGIAHFLEHMMFKGSPRFGPGAVDRRTQALGGDNNAFTGHDATAYHFSFAADRWREALAIEADRMAGLTLDPVEVDAERRVILEEIAMVEAEPWDALEERVLAALFAGHPYGRPVLGSRRDLRATGRDELAAFHRGFYRPSNAVLVVAGDVDDAAFAAAAEAFAGVADRPAPPAAPPPAPAAARADLRRVEQRMGEVPRLLLALPAPAADGADHAVLRLVSVLLGSGRASRLHRRLVDEEKVCVWAAADVGETVEPGSFLVSAELVPGTPPVRVEETVLGELAALASGRRPPSAVELERARRVLTADWVFGHERVHQQALAAGFALSLFDLGHAERDLARALAASAEEVVEVARRWLVPEGGVVGWSLPRRGAG
jgi:zinc protease